MVEMVITGLAIDTANQSPIIMLRDLSGKRQVPVNIDKALAHDIIASLKKLPSSKPRTHDLMISILKLANLNIKHIVINKNKDNNLHCLLKLTIGNSNKQKNSDVIENKPIEIESGVGDAIALAVRTNCQIWMIESILADSSLPVSQIADKEDQDEFKRFLDKVKPSDLIRYKKSNEHSDS